MSRSAYRPPVLVRVLAALPWVAILGLFLFLLAVGDRSFLLMDVRPLLGFAAAAVAGPAILLGHPGAIAVASVAGVAWALWSLAAGAGPPLAGAGLALVFGVLLAWAVFLRRAARTGDPAWARRLGLVVAALGLVGIAAVGLVAVGFFQELPPPPGARLGEVLEPLPARTLDGEPVPAWEREGTWVVDVWGTGCGPCVKALPGLARVARRWQPRGVHFVALELGSPPASVRRFADDPRYEGLVFLQPSGRLDPWELLGVAGIPQTLVLVDGKLVHHHVGAGMLSSWHLDRLLARLVAGEADPATGKEGETEGDEP